MISEDDFVKRTTITSVSIRSFDLHIRALQVIEFVFIDDVVVVVITGTDVDAHSA